MYWLSKKPINHAADAELWRKHFQTYLNVFCTSIDRDIGIDVFCDSLQFLFFSFTVNEKERSLGQEFDIVTIDKNLFWNK